MSNTEITLLAFLIGVSVIAFFWIRNLRNLNSAQSLKIASLEKEKFDFSDQFKWIISELKIVENFVASASARQCIHDRLSSMDHAGETDSLSVGAEENWKYFKGIYREVYETFFERDFQKLSSTISVQKLVSLETQWLHLDLYTQTHPEFKEKSLAILRNELSNPECSYQHLKVDIADRCEAWTPFKYWVHETVPLIRAKALEISKKEMETIRQQLTQKIGNGPLDDAQFSEIAGIITDAVSILNRDLLTGEDSAAMRRMFEPIFVVALKKLREWSGDSDRITIFAQVTKHFEKTYPKVKTEEPAQVG